MKTEKTNSKHLNILGNGGPLVDREAVVRLFRSWRQKLGCFSILTAFPTLLASQAHAVEPNDAKATLSPRAIGTSEKTVAEPNRSRNQPELLRRQSSYLLPHQQRDLNIVDAFTGGSDNCPGSAIPNGTYTSAAPFNDTGTTNDANNTINFLYEYFGPDVVVGGPDMVYTFTIKSRGAAPEILVTPTTSTYNPAIYVLRSRWGVCPSQTGNTAVYWTAFADIAGPGGVERLESDRMQDLPLNEPLYLFIDSRANSGNNSGSYTLRLKDLTIAPASGQRFDTDGDYRANLAIYRPSDNGWYLENSSGTRSEIQFGLSTDKITPADFDGDLKTDISIFRDGTWWRINSRDNTINVAQFGSPGDIPVPADYTGDGRAELAIYRNGDWWMLDLSNGEVNSLQFGLAGDKPVPGDYDGDGKTDPAIYRNGEWHIYRSSLGYTVLNFGLAGDIPVVGDYDGDGLADPAVYRAGIWYLLRSQDGFTAFQYGIATDIPVPADYDGDDRTDAAIYRNGDWYLRQSRNDWVVRRFGLPGDKPIPAAYLP